MPVGSSAAETAIPLALGRQVLDGGTERECSSCVGLWSEDEIYTATAGIQWTVL